MIGPKLMALLLEGALRDTYENGSYSIYFLNHKIAWYSGDMQARETLYRDLFDHPEHIIADLDKPEVAAQVEDWAEEVLTELKKLRGETI